MFRTAFAAIACSTILAGTAAAETRIAIDRDHPIGTIQPEIYGQFLEHLGTQVYDGIWVGQDSAIPNTDGIRDDVFGALDALSIPVIRWPGGCYADQYHWRDGIGAQGARTPRVNLEWGGTAEPNGFGTHEFFNLAERLGAKTYLNVNLGTGTPTEAADWLEYITTDGDGQLAQLRRANGREAPWVIDYLSIGNETWGCGGNMRPDYYADLYAHWATFMKTGNTRPKMIISGSHNGNMAYSDSILDHRAMRGLSDGISLHYYTLPTGDWSEHGAALGFPESDWAATMDRTLVMDQLITDQIAMIDTHEHLSDDFGLYVDEWGTWYDIEDGAPALNQPSTIRDAVVAALNFNIFHAHADRVPMTNIAQMVNVLQAMILTDGADMVLTPTYHAYEMYVPFQGATALPVSFNGPTYRNGDISFPALSATAALADDGTLLVGLVNADAKKAHEVSLPASGSVSARQMTGAAMDSQNTVADPDAVAPVAITAAPRNGKLTLTLPPRSVTVVKIGG